MQKNMLKGKTSAPQGRGSEIQKAFRLPLSGARSQPLFRFLLEHPGHAAQRILSILVSKRAFQQAARHSFYVGSEFRIRSRSLDGEWNAVRFHLEIERVAGTYRARSGHRTQRRDDQVDVVGAGALWRHPNVGAEVLNRRIFFARAFAPE